MKSTRRMPLLSQKTDAMIFFTEIKVLNFFVLGECVWRHCSDCCLDSGVWWKPMFHLQSQWSPETHLLVRNAWETSARNPFVSFCDHPLTFWAASVHRIFCTLIFLSQFHELWSWTLREWCDATFLSSRVDLREFFLKFPEEVRKRSKMSYRSFVRREHQSFFLRRIRGTTSSHFADS